MNKLEIDNNDNIVIYNVDNDVNIHFFWRSSLIIVSVN